MSNINLMFTLNGQSILIQAKLDEMFAEAALRYMQKAGLTQNDAPKYFFNSAELKLESGKTLAEYNMRDRAQINVVLASNVIGAK